MTKNIFFVATLLFSALSSYAQLKEIVIDGAKTVVDGEKVYIVLSPNSNLDLSSINPTLNVENGTISPKSGASVNFKKPVSYTFKSKKGVKTVYEVTVTKAPEDIVYVSDGRFKINGEDYYGIGVNYFDLMRRPMFNPADTSTIMGLKRLASVEIPFVRFPGPFGAGDWKRFYENDKDNFFALMDKIVRESELLNIKLIPSLFWHVLAIPEYTGEPSDALADDNSKSIAFVRQFTKEVVQRYKDSPAILGWEFANEFTLIIDLPDHKFITSQSMMNAFEEFGKTIRDIDKVRPIFTGNDAPRGSAHNLAMYGHWGKDTPEEYAQRVNMYETAPINTITIRGYYPDKPEHCPLGLVTYGDFMKKITEIGKRFGKPVFVGEFLALSQWLEPSNNWVQVSSLEDAFQERLDAIVNTDTQLSAIWVYDRPESEWDSNVTFENSRKYVLERIIDVNNSYKK